MADNAAAKPEATETGAERLMSQHAIFMDKIPDNIEENPDLLAIQALMYDDDPVEVAENFKRQGNHALTRGAPFYNNAVKFYTQALEAKAGVPENDSIYLSNRAHVYLLQGNFGKAFSDAQQALALNPGNVKAYFRAAKACVQLSKYEDAIQMSAAGLERDPNNAELQSLKAKAAAHLEEATRAARVKRDRETRVLDKYMGIVVALATRGVRMGPALYKDRSGGKEVSLDEGSQLHWPVLLIYGEVMVSDLIEDFEEDAQVGACLDQMFGDDAPRLAWDREGAYVRERLELYCWKHECAPLAPKDVLKSYVQPTLSLDPGALASAQAEMQRRLDAALAARGSQPHRADAGSGVAGGREPGSEGRPVDWLRVPEEAALGEFLASDPGLVVPGIPVFFVVAKGTAFREKFLAGKWAPP